MLMMLVSRRIVWKQIADDANDALALRVSSWLHCQEMVVVLMLTIVTAGRDTNGPPLMLMMLAACRVGFMMLLMLVHNRSCSSPVEGGRCFLVSVLLEPKNRVRPGRGKCGVFPRTQV